MSKNNAKLLLVEDDENLGLVLKDFLEMERYKVSLASDGEEGYAKYKKGSFDLCILDVMLPLKDGFTLAHEIRAMDKETPIIFLTAKSMTEDKIKGLKLGGDDYITKPFSTEELSLRINNILKRAKFKLKPENEEPQPLGKFIFDFTNQLLISGQEQKKLTKKEAEMLQLLCTFKNQVLQRKIALKTIWGEDDYFMGRSMDVYIAKLRKMLKDDPNISIQNIHNTGFKLEVVENN